MASLTDWLARTFYISEEDEQTSAQVAETQQAILKRQRDEGKIGAVKYLELSQEVQDTGARFYDEQLGKKGLAGLPAVVPWWLYVTVGVVALIYFWPLLRPFFNRLKK